MEKLQRERDPWINLHGVEQSGFLCGGKTMAACGDCFTLALMLKTVITNNATEQQKFHLTLLRHSPKHHVWGLFASGSQLSQAMLLIVVAWHSYPFT